MINTAERSATEISVVICTYNRAEVLADTLASYYSMVHSKASKFELLVVDNNSTDETQSVVERYRLVHPGIRYVFESRPGLSHARNCGINSSSGAIVAFVDDDVYFDSMWLVELEKVFNCHPEAACMGGKSIPQFAASRPDWVTDELLAFYGSTNSGNEEKPMLYPEYPFGLNMAFKRDVFDKIGQFEPKLGRKKKNLLSNEENDIFWRVNKAGLNVIYTPYAILFHRIPEERASKQWMLSRYFWQGVSDVCFEQTKEPRNKFALLRLAIQSGWELVKLTTGRNWLPRKAYWYYKALSFPQSCHVAAKWGRTRQLFVEVLVL